LSSPAVTAEASPAGPAAAVLPLAPGRSRWWVELLVIGWLCWLYDAITNLAPLRLSSALAHGRSILDFEQRLGIAPERSLDHWLAAHHTVGVVLSYYYDNAHFVVTLGILAWLWWQRSDIYRPLRNALVLVNVLAFVVFWRFPVAPPRMLGGFTDVVASTHTIGSWHTGALASDANQLAAMPSLHIAWALWCTIAVWLSSPRWWLRALATIYPFITGFAVLSTGNHYLLDIVGGALTIALAVLLVTAYERRRGRFGALRLAVGQA
jgi:membrane-associated phospholipid phosphatase